MNLKDIFKLKNPECYHCALYYFTVGHTELHVKVVKDQEFDNPEKVFYLVFAATEFIGGPTKWQGVDLRYGTVDEYLDYWKIVHPDLASTQQEAQEVWDELSHSPFYAHRLHIFATDAYPVKIYSAPPIILSYEEYHAQTRNPEVRGYTNGPHQP